MGNSRAQLFAIFFGLLTLGYNACSPVKFATYSSEGVDGGPSGPQCTASTLQYCASKQKSITVRAPTSQVDVLVIVDDSTSMEIERKKLGSRMKTFTDRLSGLDWQLCVTTTSPQSGLQGQLYKFTNNQYVLNATSPTTGKDIDGD